MFQDIERNLRQMALTNLSKKFDLSSQLFWKQPLGKIAEENKFTLSLSYMPVDTRRRFNVYKTSIRRRRSRIVFL